MPSCFQLINRQTNKADVLQRIDDQMWIDFTGKIGEDMNEWYMNWYSWAGLRFSIGQSYDQIIDDLLEYNDAERMDKIMEVLCWIDDRYTVDCWYQGK